MKPRTPSLTPERRYIDATDELVELRASAENESIAFGGHAALFGKRTWIGPPKFGFWESVRPGAFRKTIRESDIRMLFNHDPTLPLARNTISDGPGSLRLKEDKVGLLTEANWTPTTYARDLATNVGAGVVNQMSFAFQAIREDWSTDADSGEDSRELVEARLFDVSPVTFPAYPDTDAALRGFGMTLLVDALDLTDEQRARFADALRIGDISPDLLPALRAAREALDELVVTAEPAQPATPSRATEPEPAQPATPRGPDPDALRSSLIRRRMDHLTGLISDL